MIKNYKITSYTFLITVICVFMLQYVAKAQTPSLPDVTEKVDGCRGKFLHPWNDVCWDCFLPLTVAGVKVFKSSLPDTKNYSLPACACSNPFPRIGIPVSYWNPTRLADVTRDEYCFVGLGGLKIDPGIGFDGKAKRNINQKVGHHHVHWYIYPLLYWMDFLTDVLCLEQVDFDIGYITELDPLWNNDMLSVLINPEAIVFGNPVAQAACSVDCGIASANKLPSDKLFWCAGCQGSLYPFTGNVGAENTEMQASTLVVARMAAKLHRQLILWDTSGSKASDLCYKRPAPIIKKSQYRIQMGYPSRHTNGPFVCPRIGTMTIPYESGRTPAIVGENKAFIVWRKRNCCVF